MARKQPKKESRSLAARIAVEVLYVFFLVINIILMAIPALVLALAVGTKNVGDHIRKGSDERARKRLAKRKKVAHKA